MTDPGSAAERMGWLQAAHVETLRRFLVRLTFGDRELAEDLLQETMLQAWRSIADVPVGPESQLRWLFTVARRKAVDAARARAVRPSELIVEDLARHPRTDDPIDAVTAVLTVRAALPRLSREHRAVLVGLYFHDLTAGEIAERLGVPEGTVKSRAHYALRSLRATLDREDRT